MLGLVAPDQGLRCLPGSLMEVAWHEEITVFILINAPSLLNALPLFIGKKVTKCHPR